MEKHLTVQLRNLDELQYAKASCQFCTACFLRPGGDARCSSLNVGRFLKVLYCEGLVIAVCDSPRAISDASCILLHNSPCYTASSDMVPEFWFVMKQDGFQRERSALFCFKLTNGGNAAKSARWSFSEFLLVQS